MVNNETGDHIPCTATGKPILPFHPGITGVASTKKRMGLKLKEKIHEQSLTKPAPPRPAPLEDEQKLERLSTKGHFNTKPPAEVEQFLHQSAQLREQFPERELAKLEEEAKFRYKVDELHKNYYALQASERAGIQKKEVKKPNLQLPKGQHYSFTYTGFYRP